MRMLMKCQLPVEAGNAAVQSGALAQVIQQTIARANPEAVYFTLLDGKRTMLMFFDLKEQHDQVAIGEPLLTRLNANLEMTPAMIASELQAGFSALEGRAG